MKTVLCYGDSLTFGTIPGGGRHAFGDRWPSTLEKGLRERLPNEDIQIIAEGLGGRTTAFDDYSAAADRNGAKLLPSMLASHSPLDCVVIMLGTNDLKPFICGDAIGATMGMKRLAEIILTYPYPDGFPVPKIVLVAPPHNTNTSDQMMAAMFERRISESHKFAEFYTMIAKEINCEFLDTSTIANPSPIDGVHLDAANTKAIGTALVPVVQKILES